MGSHTFYWQCILIDLKSVSLMNSGLFYFKSQNNPAACFPMALFYSSEYTLMVMCLLWCTLTDFLNGQSMHFECYVFSFL